MRGVVRNRKVLLLFVFVGLGLFTQSRVSLTLPNWLQDMLTLTFGVLFEALPFVLLGTLLSSLLQTFVPSSAILKILPKRAIPRRALLSVTGSVLPVCECGNVPLARGLIAKGVRAEDALVFILAAPIINPITLLTTWQAFPDNHMTLYIRLLAAFLIANFIGWEMANTRQKLTTDTFDSYCDVHNEKTKVGKKSFLSVKSLQKIAHTFSDEASALLPALIGGSLIAGIIQTVVPRSVLVSIAAEPVLAILSMILLAFVVSICANVDAFFALSLSGIFPMSAIIAFLVFGPMIDMKMLALLRTTFTTSTLLRVSSMVFLLSLLTGLVAHYVI